MIVASEGNHLESREAREIYEILRLHVLALADPAREWSIAIEERPWSRFEGKRITIAIDIVPWQRSSKHV